MLRGRGHNLDLEIKTDIIEDLIERQKLRELSQQYTLTAIASRYNTTRTTVFNIAQGLPTEDDRLC